MTRVPLVLGVVLVAIWLLLNGAGRPGQWLVATILALVVLRVFANLRPLRPTLRRLHLAAPLAVHVVLDILRSNLAVARIVLGLVGRRQIRSGFLDIPLELRDPHGLSILASIITSTPGTVWAGVSLDGRTLTLHVLDLADEDEWIRLIKQRYERPLISMFE